MAMAYWTALCLVLYCVATSAQESSGGPASSPNNSSGLSGPGIAPMASTMGPGMLQDIDLGAPSPGPSSMPGALQADLSVLAGGVSNISINNPTIPRTFIPSGSGDSLFDACGCGQNYNPVCGMDGQAYGNACIANCTNTVATMGSCPTCSMVANKSCNCGSVAYEPVCAKSITYDTSCDAECSGQACYTPGQCQYTTNSSLAFLQPNMSRGPSGRFKTVGAAANSTILPDATKPPLHDYGDALTKALLFLESQRSGMLPKRYLSWREDSCFACKGKYGEDLSGGFYNSGASFLKMGLQSAFTVTNLAWGYLSFPDGFARTNTKEHIEDLIIWGADFLVNSWNSTAQTYVAAMGNATNDYNFFGPVEEYEDYLDRPIFYLDAQNPGSEILGEAAAALAATYLSMGGGDDYLSVAEEVYAFGTGAGKGSYKNATNLGVLQQQLLTPSTEYMDELAWGAAWLYKATNNSMYLDDARMYYLDCCNGTGQQGWTYEPVVKTPALHVLMFEIDPENAAWYSFNARAFFDQYIRFPVPSVSHTLLGSAYPYHWGSLRPAQNTAFLSFQFSKLLANVDPMYGARLFNYALYQLDYVLGSGGRSWVVGVGNDYPKYLWHKASYVAAIAWESRGKFQWLGRKTGFWTSPSDPALVNPFIIMKSGLEMRGNFKEQPFIAYGALFGSPTRRDELVPSRRDYTYAEPTTEGQGGFIGNLAAMAGYFTSTAPIDICSLDLGWGHPNATIDSRSVCTGPAMAPKGAVTGSAG